EMYTQTVAIEMLLARQFGLLGDSIKDEYLILNLLGSREDFAKSITPLIFPTEEQKKNRDTIFKNLLESDLPWFLKKWEEKFVKHGKKYAIGDKFSLADIFLATMIESGFRSNKLTKECFEPLVTL